MTPLGTMKLHAKAAMLQVLNPDYSNGMAYYFALAELDSYAAGVLAAKFPDCDPCYFDNNIPAFLEWFMGSYEKIERDDGGPKIL